MIKPSYRVSAFDKKTGEEIFCEDFSSTCKCADNIKMNLTETDYKIQLTKIEVVTSSAFWNTDVDTLIETDENGFCNIHAEEETPLPCPFCGNSHLEVIDESGWQVSCTDCGIVNRAWETKEDAISVWNTRNYIPSAE